MAQLSANQGRAHPCAPTPPPRLPGSGGGRETHRGTSSRGRAHHMGRAHPLKQKKRGPKFTLYCLIQTLMVILLKTMIPITDDINFIKKLPIDEQKEYLKAYLKADQLETKNRCTGDFLEFIKYIWPEFISGHHHKIISEKFNRIASGENKRLIVNMPPRHTKSEFASNYLPAWMIGKNPKLKIIQATHTAELAVRFGRKAKHVIDSHEYQEIFETSLQEDSKAAGRWETAQEVSTLR